MAERIAESGARRRRQIHRVPRQLKLKQNQPYVYDPMWISIGPYHNGEPHLQQLEEFKRETVNMFLMDVNGWKDRQIYCSKIFERIDEIRSCYVGVHAEEFDDASLCEMMFHDACFIIYHIMVALGNEEARLLCQQHLGWSGFNSLHAELHMLENQIPYWVVKLLLILKFGEIEGKELICNYLSNVTFGELDKRTVIPWEEGEEEDPLHFLEAIQRLLARKGQEQEQEMERCNNNITELVWKISSWIFKIFKICCQIIWMKKKDDVKGLRRELLSIKYFSRQFYSVTDLKAKGIHFKPSSTCLKDVRFKSHALYGQLQLPIWFVSHHSYVFFPNMIAYEMSPGTNTDLVMTSYVSLMKTLIDSPKDVKELRAKGILFSNLGNDMEVTKLFQEIDTMGMGIDLFYHLKMSIQQHCSSKAKTWMAELIYTYFRSPWTAIALLAATFLIVLTFLQTYYTINHS